MWANKKTLTFVIISKDTTMKHYLPLYALLAFMPLASCSDDEPTVGSVSLSVSEASSLKPVDLR